MGASGTAYSRGRFPSRTGIGGRWHEPAVPKGTIPGGRWHEPAGKPQQAFRSSRFSGSFLIAGTTRDSTGAALPNCEVELYHATSDTVVLRTTSDEVGIFSFAIGNNSDYYYIRAYKVGAPDVAGTSIDTLRAE